MEKVLITGCSSGLGLETCLLLAEHGFDVAAAVRKSSDTRLLEAQIEDKKLSSTLQIEYLDVVQDINDGKQTEALLHKYDGFDIVIFNAGVLYFGLADKLPLEAVTKIIETNLLAQIILAQRVIKAMKQQKHGKLIFISSLAGRRGLPFLSAYNASKAGLAGFAESLYLELAADGIETFLLEPGYYSTALWRHDIPYQDEYSKKLKKLSNSFSSERDVKEVTFQILKICQSKKTRFRTTFGFSSYLQCRFKPLIYSKIGKKAYLWLLKRMN